MSAAQAGLKGGRGQAVALLFVSLAIFAASLLWLYDAYHRQDAATQVRALREGTSLQPEEIDAAIEVLGSLPLDLFPAETAHHLANLRFQQAAGTWPVPRSELEALHEAYRSALVEAPARPYAWARLAYLERALGANPERVIQLLRQSIYVGPSEPALALWRLRLAARLRPFWDDAFANLMPRQAAAAWRGPSRALVELALDRDMMDVVREGLRHSPEALERFEALVARVLRIRERQRG